MLQNNKIEKSKTFLKSQKGKKVLPDLRTAILASLRGYFQGSYPNKLDGIASEVGYYPLNEATFEEKEKIEEIISELEKREGTNLYGKDS